ncbi:SDR family oxidoreductase [Niallia taxi]|uniref:SDR family oxidoreductase n=1 Tax=Niallia taxi TaxID=2499688 RepID=UPI0011A73325
MNELFDLTGKTAIVTGGGRGLGKEMAACLGEAGANIVICSRKLENCSETVEFLKEKGIQAIALACDVANQKEIEEVIVKTEEQFGSIDILINNSGTSWIAPTLDYPEDKWDKVMDVNVKGAFLFSQAAAKKMLQQKSGKIINISSVTALFGTHPLFLDAIAYNTSKGAIITLTKELAVKLAPYNIQVNAIAPGFFPTKITSVLEKHEKQLLMKIPAHRAGDSKDLRGLTLLLAGSGSDYITGQTIAIDGGMSTML